MPGRHVRSPSSSARIPSDGSTSARKISSSIQLVVNAKGWRKSPGASLLRLVCLLSYFFDVSKFLQMRTPISACTRLRRSSTALDWLTAFTESSAPRNSFTARTRIARCSRAPVDRSSAELPVLADSSTWFPARVPSHRSNPPSVSRLFFILTVHSFFFFSQSETDGSQR
jgi:hypothetical protein